MQVTDLIVNESFMFMFYLIFVYIFDRVIFNQNIITGASSENDRHLFDDSVTLGVQQKPSSHKTTQSRSIRFP